jgi:hypothetical protein
VRNVDNKNEEHQIIRKQSPRMGVNVSKSVKEKLQPIFSNQEKTGAPALVQIAEDMELEETLRLLSEEKRVHGSYTIIWCTPTDRLINRAASFHINPHMLVRAAALKLARRLDSEQTSGDVLKSLMPRIERAKAKKKAEKEKAAAS